MKLHITVLFIVAQLLGFSKLAAGEPVLLPSSLSLKIGERVYFTGADLVPGDVVLLHVGRSTRLYAADSSGYIKQEITEYPPPTTNQHHQVTYSLATLNSGVSTNFTVNYSPERIDPPYNIISRLSFSADGNVIYLESKIGIGLAYHAEWSPTINGPWQSDGSIIKFWSANQGSNITFSIPTPRSTQAFFRIVPAL